MTQSTNGEQVSPSMLASYTVEVPERQTQSGGYPSWLDREVQRRIQDYDPANPLGISEYLDWAVVVYVPVLVVVSGALNVYAFCVMQVMVSMRARTHTHTNTHIKMHIHTMALIYNSSE